MHGPTRSSDENATAPLRQRIGWAALSAAGLWLLGAYSYSSHENYRLADCYANPQHYDGRIVKLGSEAVIVSRDTSGFTLREGQARVRVLSPVPEAAVGSYVFVRGVFHQGGWIDPLAVRVATGRRLKMIVSIVPGLWVACLCLAHFRINWKQLALEHRPHA